MLSTAKKNAVLATMADLLEANRKKIIQLNKEDVDAYDGEDQSMFDRLKVNDKKVDGMIKSVLEVREGGDPVGKIRYQHTKENGLRIEDKSVPFGTILIIYESRPDVTIEAAALAFKAGNKILLKGGKESKKSNQKLVEIWHESLTKNGLKTDWIEYLGFNRQETQDFLKKTTKRIDLIVPRGGERLIEFVKTHAKVPVIVSGRGNNFLYVHSEADFEKVEPIIVNAKTQKISACNALDKILFDKNIPNLKAKVLGILKTLETAGTEILTDNHTASLLNGQAYGVDASQTIWEEEFLALKIMVGIVENQEEAIQKINDFSGGHSVTIMTENESIAEHFMYEVDAAQVYHNASTRFSDGGQFGLGAELGISTEKLHHRGPLGLDQLVTNKWFCYGTGQIRN